MSENTAVTLAAPVAIAGVSQGDYDKQEAFRVALQENLPAIMAVLPKGVRAEKIASVALAALQENPKLLDCSPLSQFKAVYKSATLNLMIGMTCDIVGPIRGKAECWVRVKGVVELARRAGGIQWAREGYVCDGDVFEYEERGDGTHFRHVPSGVPNKDGSNVTHIYATVILPTGVRVYEVWTMGRCLAHKERFAKDTKPGSAWAEHPLAMMAKSVVKAALRFAPLSADVMQVIASGDDVSNGSFEVLDNPDEALKLSAGAFDALDEMDAPRMTLDDAEAMVLPGGAKSWGGKGGSRLGDLKVSLLDRVYAWTQEDDEKRTKFATLALACEIVAADKRDAEASNDLDAAA